MADLFIELILCGYLVYLIQSCCVFYSFSVVYHKDASICPACLCRAASFPTVLFPCVIFPLVFSDVLCPEWNRAPSADYRLLRRQFVWVYVGHVKKKKWTQSGGGSVPTVVGIFRSLSVCLSSSPSASLSFPFISPSSLSLFLFLYACPHLHVSLCALLSSPLYSIYPIIDQQQHQQTVNVHCNKFF